ncbi:MAG: beta-ketoacyl synthase N-terminal-like domain-containing protein [Chthoniobacteraceae bacterium]|jgi:3-oxoacyl-(acyl-carrier-protein) synthase
MDAFITSCDWITPLGCGLAEVWDAILAGMRAPVRELPGPVGAKPRFAATIPPKLADAAARNPRLRRSSNISLFAAQAAANAGAMFKAAGADRAAIIFAVSDGGVIHTRKFYDQVVREGAGSPLLFPETVYNAPASHIAALNSFDGMTYTVAGDASAGLAALRLGADLIESGRIDHCLVVGAQEVDWILCEAYGQWRLCSSAVEIGSNRGALIAEGAAAVTLSREGGYRLSVSDCVPFFRQAEAGASLAAALAQLPTAPSRVIGSANGTFVDRAESSAIEAAYGQIPALFPKVSLGDAFGASALFQIICAVQSLSRDPAGAVLVPVIGLNQHAAAALVQVSTPTGSTPG